MRIVLLLLAALALAPAPAAAQPFVRVREPAHGRLAAGDSALENGALFDTWRIRTRPGSAYFIYLTAEFDAYVAAGPGIAPRCGDGCAASVQGPGGSFGAEMMFVPERPGVHSIRAGAVRAGQAGRYQLQVERMELRGDAADTVPVADTDPLTPEELADAAEAQALERLPMLEAGSPARGTLRPGARNAHGEPYDEWTLFAAAYDTVTLVMESGEFHPVLRILREGPDGWEEVAAGDGGGTRSTVTLTQTRHELYRVQAAGRGERAGGPYTIHVTGTGGATEDAVMTADEPGAEP